jgi:poly(A) polymerase
MGQVVESAQNFPIVYERDKHPLRASMVDEDALKVTARLARFGYKAHVVGGGVRDLLLGKQPKDFDIATDARPSDIRKIFRNSRIIGRRFKLAHVFFGKDKNIEVATFRANAEPVEDGDNIELGGEEQLVDDNNFGTEMTDALRRDITINGLFFDPASECIIDYVGGMDDIQRGAIRVIGNPPVRFVEDPVRLLRVARHAARSGFVIDSDTYDAVLRSGELLQAASQVRIFEEVRKDILSGNFLDFLEQLQKTNLLQYIFPNIESNQLVAGSHFSETIRRFDNLIESATHPISTTVGLAIIARFCQNKNLNKKEITKSETAQSVPLSLEEEMPFVSQEALIAHITDAFPLLTVPRRERERLEAILQIWWGLYHDIDCGLSNRTIFRITSEVKDFLKVLPDGSRDRDIFSRCRRLFEKGAQDLSDPMGGEVKSRRNNNSRRRRSSKRGRHNSEVCNGSSL